jgi:hypothetical protein
VNRMQIRATQFVLVRHRTDVDGEHELCDVIGPFNTKENALAAKRDLTGFVDGDLSALPLRDVAP